MRHPKKPAATNVAGMRKEAGLGYGYPPAEGWTEAATRSREGRLSPMSECRTWQDWAGMIVLASLAAVVLVRWTRGKRY